MSHAIAIDTTIDTAVAGCSASIPNTIADTASAAAGRRAIRAGKGARSQVCPRALR